MKKIFNFRNFVIFIVLLNILAIGIRIYASYQRNKPATLDRIQLEITDLENKIKNGFVKGNDLITLMDIHYNDKTLFLSFMANTIDSKDLESGFKLGNSVPQPVKDLYCADKKDIRPLLDNGLIIKITYFTSNKIDIGSFLIDKNDCNTVKSK